MRERIWAWEYAGAEGNEGQWRSSKGACPSQAYVICEYIRAGRIEALERQVKAADALAEALTPFAVTLERYSGFTEYALFGIWEDVNGAAGRKLNILRMANFDDAKAALAAYRATKEGGA